MHKRSNSELIGVDLDFSSQVEELLSRMTLEEKIGQMNQYSSTWDITGPIPEDVDEKERYQQIAAGRVGSMLNIYGVEATRKAQRIAVEGSRLGIPLLFGYDVIHGYKTMFPIPIADASSWDLDVVKTATRVAAKEAASSGIHWVFAPVMDITREPRWGRIIEGAGEDPFLGSKIAVARIKGFQGNDLSRTDTVAATAKHFAGYGFVLAGLEYNTIELSRNTLLNMVLPPFKAAVEAGVASVMNAFNDFEGIPITAHVGLQRSLLKEDWNFEGVIVSDWDTIGEMVKHQYTKDLREATKKAILAGTDVDMETRGFENYLQDLVESGEIDEALVDDAARRILSLKFQLGLFDDPYAYCNEVSEKENILTNEHKSLARDAARKSIVLLKSENNLLPVSKSARSIAVIGSLANDNDTPLGTWRGQSEDNSAISLLEGIQAAVSSQTKVTFAKGYTLASNEREFTEELDFSNADDTSELEKAITIAEKAEVVIVAVGEDCFQTGEGRSQTDISLKGKQVELLKGLLKVNTNVIVVLMNGRPIAEPWMYENMPAILECWHLGSESGHAIADVLFGDYNPSGKLPVSIPRNVGQVPIFYNHTNTGRQVSRSPDPNFVFWSHYTDSEKTPQFYFGHGLSYTSFEYSNLKISSSTITIRETLEVSIDLKNTGKYDGEEVVQLYINDKYSSVIRPVKELKGFKKIFLKAGENKKVSFHITSEELSFYGADGAFIAEPGEFDIMVGGNSQDLLITTFELVD